MDNFENIQLYRTNVYLGGNMKYDLVLDDTGEKLFVKDFHITPISGQIPVNMNYEEYLLKSTHQDNIKYFYNNLSGSSFYKDNVDPYINSKWPILYTNCNLIQTYDDNWFMGCKRSDYHKYNKQFEFLVPLWIEKYDKIDFIIELWANTSKRSKSTKHISTKILTIYNDLEQIDNKYPEFHKNFCSYMLNYMKYIGLENYQKNITKVENGKLYKDVEYVTGGSNDMMNIDLSEKSAYVHGLNIETGQIETKSIYDLGYQLTSREIPMMDFNQKLIESFSKYKFISKQLFNFNLCFNIQDIAAPNICNNMMYSNVMVKVKVRIGDKILPIKDFLTNYENQPKHDIYPITMSDVYNPKNNTANVFDFLRDNKAVDYMYINKITQQIPFWSLADNSDYIFNVYSGYSGRACEILENLAEENTPVSRKSLYYIFKDSFDPNLKNYRIEANNIFWADFIQLNDGELMGFLSYTNLQKYEFTNISNWIKYAKYNIDEDVINELKKLYVQKIALIYCKDGGVLANQSKTITNDVYSFYKNGIMFFISKDINKLTFKFIQQSLNEYNKGNDINDNRLKLIGKVLNSIVYPKVIKFTNGLSYSLINQKLKTIKEIEYFENDMYDNYVLRYDGKIKPTFVDTLIDGNEPNIFYFKDVVNINELSGSKYAKYSQLGYDPVFPSIDYYSIKSLPLNHDIYPDFEDVKEENKNQKDGVNNAQGNIYEYKWFNNGNHILLPTKINTIFKSNKTDAYAVLIEFFSQFLSSNESDSLVVITRKNNEDEDVFNIPIKILNVMNLYRSDINILSTWEENNENWYELDIKLELK